MLLGIEFFGSAQLLSMPGPNVGAIHTVIIKSMNQRKINVSKCGRSIGNDRSIGIGEETYVLSISFKNCQIWELLRDSVRRVVK